MVDMGQADRSLYRTPRGTEDHESVFSRDRARGRALQNEYDIYLACADDGKGGDITRNGKPLLTFGEWLRN